MALARVGSYVMILLGVALMALTSTPVFFVIGLLLLIGGVVVRLVFYRCPHCHRLLPGRAPLDMDYCPYCGKRLE